MSFGVVGGTCGENQILKATIILCQARKTRWLDFKQTMSEVGFRKRELWQSSEMSLTTHLHISDNGGKKLDELPSSLLRGKEPSWAPTLTTPIWPAWASRGWGRQWLTETGFLSNGTSVLLRPDWAVPPLNTFPFLGVTLPPIFQARSVSEFLSTFKCLHLFTYTWIRLPSFRKPATTCWKLDYGSLCGWSKPNTSPSLNLTCCSARACASTCKAWRLRDSLFIFSFAWCLSRSLTLSKCSVNMVGRMHKEMSVTVLEVCALGMVLACGERSTEGFCFVRAGGSWVSTEQFSTLVSLAPGCWDVSTDPASPRAGSTEHFAEWALRSSSPFYSWLQTGPIWDTPMNTSSLYEAKSEEQIPP